MDSGMEKVYSYPAYIRGLGGILVVLCICIALTGCVINEYPPLSSHQPASKLFADTMGLKEAFTKHEELRALFEQAASRSIPLADAAKADYYSYDYYDDGTYAYYYRNDKGRTITDDSMRVDKKLLMPYTKWKSYYQELIFECVRLNAGCV